MTSYRFPRSHRLTRQAELVTVLRRGKRIRTKFLDIRTMPSPSMHPRAGLIVAKHGYRSVDRNRIKRKLREAIRLHLFPKLRQVDFVIRTRDEIYNASDEDLQADVEQAFERMVGNQRDA